MMRRDVQFEVLLPWGWRRGWTLALLLAACGGRSETTGQRHDDQDAGQIDAGSGDAQYVDAGGASDLGVQPDAARGDSIDSTPGDPQTDAGSVGPSDGMPLPNVGPDGPVISESCDTRVQATSQIRRITNQQYDRTIRDLLGVTTLIPEGTEPPSSLLAPSHDNGLTDRDWQGYQSAAAAIAERVMSDPDLLSNFVKCDLADRNGCMRETIARFGRRAFRRPLRDSEQTAFARLNEVGAPAPAEEVARVILETFLVSPSFLQRVEITELTDADGNFVLSSHEVATRLSYLLWGSMPDPQLDEAADAGELTNSDQVLAQAQRMLADPRASDMVREFTHEYLGMGPGTAWLQAVKDETLFPQFSPELLPVLAAESELFFDRIVLGEGTFSDLFLSQLGFINEQTSVLYGIDPGQFGRELTEVQLADRPGFLTRIGFLTATSNATRTSPIRRGGFIVNRRSS